MGNLAASRDLQAHGLDCNHKWYYGREAWAQWPSACLSQPLSKNINASIARSKAAGTGFVYAVQHILHYTRCARVVQGFDLEVTVMDPIECLLYIKCLASMCTWTVWTLRCCFYNRLLVCISLPCCLIMQNDFLLSLMVSL